MRTMSPHHVMSNLTQEWVDILSRWHLHYFSIPSTFITLITLLVDPLLLTCIFLSRALRQETRYLLMANTLIADMLFLILNQATILCIFIAAQIPWIVCGLVTAVTVTTCCSAILTVTLMVVDTYAAVRWPLHYHVLLPPARTQCILAGVWVLAALYPFTLLILMRQRDNLNEMLPVCKVLFFLSDIEIEIVGIHFYFLVTAAICTMLIFYCYIRLYMVTRTQGIWQNRYSRARVTLLAHGLLLLLYFTPNFVFTLEIALFKKNNLSQDVRVWINTVNKCVFMLLPRALAPYLYGLRYREISENVMQLLFRNSRPGRSTVS